MSGETLALIIGTVVLVWLGIAAVLVWAAWGSERDGY